MGDYSHGGNIFFYASILNCSPFEIIDLSSNISPFIFEECFVDIVKNHNYLKILPSSYGFLLKNELSKKYGIDKDCIATGTGTSEIIKSVCHVFSGKQCLLFAPSYIDYEKYASFYGLDITFNYLNKEENFDFSFEKLDFGKTDIVFICNPNNPTGSIVKRDVIVSLLNKYKNTLFVVDESYLPFVMDENEYTLLGYDFENLLVLRSFSKIYGVAGLRVGFCFSANRKLIREIEKFNLEWGISTLSERIAIELLSFDTGIIAGKLQNIKANFLKNLSEFHKLCIYPGNANFVLVSMKVKDADSLFNSMLKRKILIRNCSNFRGLNNKFFRISVKEEHFMERFLQALREFFNEI